MKVQTYILEASGRLTPLKERIEQSISSTIELVSAKMSLPNVDIVVDDLSPLAIPETGVGGYAPSAHLVEVHIDPTHAHITEGLEVELQSTVAHELHHAARWAAVGYGTTLLEAMVSEGLADHFDQEIYGGEPKLWSVALSEKKLGDWSLKSQEELMNKKYNHSAWFFGTSTEIPRWAGYAIGYKLVKQYMQETGRTASELVAEPAQSFISDLQNL